MQDMKRRIEVFMAVLLLLGACLFAKESPFMVGSGNAREGQVCIVVDAGHGGDDPGKIGINKAKEKEINLKIATKLKDLLEKDGIKIIMTREDDNGLYQPSSKNQKVEDMRRRCEIISQAKPVFTVSIHQNSYPDEAVKGAQVFYYGQSKHREAKANESYYLLKKTESPTVIVECGFLSNYEEAELLSTDAYQDKVAKAVEMGILKCLGAGKE